MTFVMMATAALVIAMHLFSLSCHWKIISKLDVQHIQTSAFFELYYHTCHQGTHQMQHTLKESQ
jgi:hypothetical protein